MSNTVSFLNPEKLPESVVSRSDIPTSGGGFGRYGSVTRNASLTHETKPIENGSIEEPNPSHTDDTNYPFFIDWITISQVHNNGGLPVVAGGLVESFDENGEKEWQTLKYIQHEGSFESKILVRCDGNVVYLSGNVSRFGRPDNLFGLSLPQVIDKANQILSFYNLPPFTIGETFFLQGSKDSDCLAYTGAVISRLDLTANYSTGSPENAEKFLRWLSTQQDNRIKTGTYGDSHTVDFGRGSKRLYHKVYNKSVQLSTSKHKTLSSRVLDYVSVNGIIRHEVTLKSRFLRDGGLRFLGVVTMEHLNNIYQDKAQILMRAERSSEGFDSLPDQLRLTARDWKAGRQFSGSRAKFYRHRKELLSYGFDISVPCANPDEKPVIEVITLSPCIAPEWYWQIAA
jgi:hypothetical protein